MGNIRDCEKWKRADPMSEGDKRKYRMINTELLRSSDEEQQMKNV